MLALQQGCPGVTARTWLFRRWRDRRRSATWLRGTGMGWAIGAGRVGSTLAPIAIGFFVSVGVWLVFASFAVSLAVAAISMLVLGRETKQQSLETASADSQPAG